MKRVYLLIVTSDDSGKLITVGVYETPELARRSSQEWLGTYSDIETEVRPQMVREHVVMKDEIRK